MSVGSAKTKKIQFLTLQNAELVLLVSKLLSVYPVEDMPDDYEHKFIKHSLLNLKLLEAPKPPEPEFKCSVCGIELPEYQARSSRAKCSKCYLIWKKEKRGGK